MIYVTNRIARKAIFDAFRKMMEEGHFPSVGYIGGGGFVTHWNEYHKWKTVFAQIVHNHLVRNGFPDGVMGGYRSQKYESYVARAISLVTPDLIREKENEL